MDGLKAKVEGIKASDGLVLLRVANSTSGWKMWRDEWEVQRLVTGVSYEFRLQEDHLAAWAPLPFHREQISAFVKRCGAGGQVTKALLAKGEAAAAKAIAADAAKAFTMAGASPEAVAIAKRLMPAGYAALSAACMRVGASQSQTEQVYALLTSEHIKPSEYVSWLAEHALEMFRKDAHHLTLSYDHADRLASRSTAVLSDRVEALMLSNLRSVEVQGDTGRMLGRFQGEVAEKFDLTEDEAHKLVNEAVWQGRDDKGRRLFDAIPFKKDPKTGKGSLFFCLRNVMGLREKTCAQGVVAQTSLRLPRKLRIPDAAFSDLDDDKSQQAAVDAIASQPFTVLIGPAGSGKSHIVRTVADAAREAGLTVAMTATTGQAAKVLDKDNGRTLHSFLGVVPGTVNHSHKAEAVDILVVDEVSMLDTDLASPLGSYMKAGLARRVVLVGDESQIPPVGPGKVLYDLIHSATVAPYVKRLDTVHRVAAGTEEDQGRSRILDLSEAVRQGASLPDITASRAITVRPIKDPLAAANEIAETANPVEHPDTMIITAYYYGELGVYALNRRMRDRHLGPSDDLWLPGERVVQRRGGRWTPVGAKENETVLILNGDRGTVRSVTDDAVVVDYGGTLVELTGAEIEPGRAVIEPDYALTVHRAQGSQAGTVVVVVDPDQTKMWDDKAIGYTAVTRARKRLIVYGNLQVLAGASGEKPKVERRQTALPKQLDAARSAPSKEVGR